MSCSPDLGITDLELCIAHAQPRLSRYSDLVNENSVKHIYYVQHFEGSTTTTTTYVTHISHMHACHDVMYVSDAFQLVLVEVTVFLGLMWLAEYTS